MSPAAAQGRRSASGHDVSIDDTVAAVSGGRKAGVQLGNFGLRLESVTTGLARAHYDSGALFCDDAPISIRGLLPLPLPDGDRHYFIADCFGSS